MQIPPSSRFRPVRRPIARIAGLCVFAMALAGGDHRAFRSAQAQVTTSQGALAALGPGRRPAHAAPAHPAHAARTAHGGERHPANRAARETTHPARPARAVAAHPPAATIPAGPPPPPVFRAPVINVPLHPPPPPPPVPVVQTAVGVATPLPGGLRITFGSGSADLNPATMQALHGIAARLRADPAVRINLDALSGGSPDDPSTPRRMALERGLAARAVLINDGIASTRIYVRVIGQAPGTTAPGVPPDRVDMVMSAPDGSAAAAAAAAPGGGAGAPVAPSPVATSPAPLPVAPASPPPVPGPVGR